MFSPDPWARAFIQAFPAGHGETDALEEALNVLSVYCSAGLSVPGGLSGLNDARRMARTIDAALAGTKTASDAARHARNFFLLMITKTCFYHHKMIIRQIQKRLNEKSGLLEAALETPFEADSAFAALVKQSLCAKTHARDVELTIRTVPGLVGGIRLRIGSVLFDASLKTGLERMMSDLSAPF